MATQTLPVVYDLNLYTGTTYMRMFRWLPDSTTPQDFTGWTARLLIGPGQGSALVTAAPALSPGGNVVIRLTVTQIGLLDPGTYAYNVDLTDPDGNIIRFLRGAVRVIKDVTA